MNSIGSAHAEVILVPEDLFARALPIECFSLSVAISDRLEPVVFVGIAALRLLAVMFAVTRPQNRL
jgi:hypothetical protein